MRNKDTDPKKGYLIHFTPGRGEGGGMSEMSENGIESLHMKFFVNNFVDF